MSDMNYQDSVWVNRKFFFFLAACFLALLLSTGYLSYRQFFAPHTEGLVQGAKVAGMQDVSTMDEDALLAVVGKMVLLPNERPTFASVSDTQKLKGKELFANARTGDIVMIFQKAQKIVIFRPTTSQIVEVAKIDLQTEPIIIPSSTPVPTVPPTPTITTIVPTTAQAASASGGLQ